MKKILVTGGCGFIGSYFVKKQVESGNFVVNLDSLTYAGNPNNVEAVANSTNYVFVENSINNQSLVQNLLEQYQIDYLINFAAESHVDNSIRSSEIFIQTNINGTHSLLQASLQHYKQNNKSDFRFLHVSTDEVFGSLSLTDQPFTKHSRYRPNSPYSASKASSDHLVRAWFETFKLPTIITNCSNNFGPFQHQEKLIPTTIRCCLQNKDIPIYGNGSNIRDWIFVADHCHGIDLALKKGEIGETYLFGGGCEFTNLDIAKQICTILDKLQPKSHNISYQQQIKFVHDRAGHDFRYAINNTDSFNELGFSPSKSFTDRLTETIIHYLSIYGN